MADAPKQPQIRRKREPNAGSFKAGDDRINRGGRPKTIREIEAMLDSEHRTAENMRAVFQRLKALALGEVVDVPIPGGKGETELQLQADPAFMKMYLERTLGPVKDLALDLSDAPEAVLRWVETNLGPQAN